MGVKSRVQKQLREQSGRFRVLRLKKGGHQKKGLAVLPLGRTLQEAGSFSPELVRLDGAAWDVRAGPFGVNVDRHQFSAMPTEDAVQHRKLALAIAKCTFSTEQRDAIVHERMGRVGAHHLEVAEQSMANVVYLGGLRGREENLRFPKQVQWSTRREALGGAMSDLPVTAYAAMRMKALLMTEDTETVKEVWEEAWRNTRAKCADMKRPPWPSLEFEEAEQVVKSMLGGYEDSYTRDAIFNEEQLYDREVVDTSMGPHSETYTEFAVDKRYERTIELAGELAKLERAERRMNDMLAQGMMGMASDLRDMMKDVNEGEMPEEGHGLPNTDEAGKFKWGEMTIKEFPLVKQLPTHYMARTPIARDEGCNPRNIYRWCTDMRIFSRYKKNPGGAVLMDLSGSMDIEQAQVVRLMELIPNGVAAIYAGSSDGTGTLGIIARNGKFAVHDNWDEALGMGLNVIDGPALDWLARQDGPRFWVSDGYVTGVPLDGGSANSGESCTIALRMDVARKMRRHDIIRLATVRDAIHAFETGVLR